MRRLFKGGLREIGGRYPFMVRVHEEPFFN